MEQEAVDQARGIDAGAVAPAAPPVSATEQLAQLTLDSMPLWMKVPGGIRRFRLVMAVVVTITIVVLAITVSRGFSQVDADISVPHLAR